MAWANKDSVRYGQVDKRVLAKETSDQSVAGLEIHRNAICTQAETSLKRYGTALYGQPVVGTATARPFFLRLAGIGDFVIEASDLKFRFWKDGVLVPSYSLTTTYATADLPNMHVEQTATRLKITCPGHMPRVLERVADNSWTLTDFDNSNGPWLTYREQKDSIALLAPFLLAGLVVAAVAP